MSVRRQTGSRGEARRSMPRDPDLLFCSNCSVSIAQTEIETGHVRQTPSGGLLCVLCAQATPERRRARRAALEQEFADDAPLLVAIPDTSRRDTAPGHVEELRARVARLERLVFELEQRLRAVEDRDPPLHADPPRESDQHRKTAARRVD